MEEHTKLYGICENKCLVEVVPKKDTVTKTELEKMKKEMFLLIYPVGSIYFSTSNTNPSDNFGGTWAQWGSGRVPVGVDVTQDEFKISEKTGGEKNHVLSAGEIPAHKHSIGSHNHGLPNHTHTIPAHSHGLNDHTHGPGSFVIEMDGAHQHAISYKRGGASGTDINHISSGESSSSTTGVCEIGGLHNHKISPLSKTGPATGNTANSSVLTSGQGGSGNTQNSTAFDSGTYGSGQAHNNLQPYITCYMWKRTA